MKRPVLTGLGPLSPFGAGVEPLWKALVSGTSATVRLSRFSSLHDTVGSEIKDIDFDDIIGNGTFRRAADLSKYALASFQLAIRDAGLDSVKGEKSAMVTAITNGAMNYTQAYHTALITGGVEDISPLLFSDSVLNAPAGNASICYGIQGAVHTIIGGTAASIKAVMMASGLIQENKIATSFVVSAEEMNELSFHCWQKFGESAMSEGAGVLLIEDEEKRRGRQLYCCIAGYASHIDTASNRSFRVAVDRALSMAGMEKHDLDFALIDMPPGKKERYLDGIPSGSISRYTGNAFCVSSAWNIMLGAYIIYKDTLPDSFMAKCKEKRKSNTIQNGIVCSLEETGTAAALVLSKAESREQT